MLIAIAILPMLLSYAKQTSAQELANGMPSTTAATAAMTYGLGGYKMVDKKMVMVPDDARLLKTDNDVKSYKTNDHTDTQFKPCRVELDKDNDFEVFYDEDTANGGCTVDFVMDKIDEAKKTIKTRIKVKDKKMACLEDCGNESELGASSKNLVPFTYSMSNDEFKKQHKGPSYEKDQTSCKEVCAKNGGKCMASATSLQLAWNKCARKQNSVRARAWIQLVGEPISEWSAEIEDEPGRNKEYPDDATFELSIKMGDNPNYSGNNVPLFTVKGPSGTSRFLDNDTNGYYIYPECFLDDRLPMIPEPKFWTIKSGNAQINGKHLLVFHLLPQKATRIFDKEGKLQNNQPPAPGMPKCKGKLSIAFKNVVGLLQSMPEPTTTTQTTEKTTTVGTTNTTAPVATTSTATSQGTTTTTSIMTATTSEMTMTATKETETTAAPSEGNNTVLIVAIVVGTVVLLLIIVAALVWFFCRRGKKEDDNEEDAEVDSEIDSMDTVRENATKERGEE